MNFNLGVQYEFRQNYLLDRHVSGLLRRRPARSGGSSTPSRSIIWKEIPLRRTRVFAASQNYRPYPNYGDIRVRSNFGHSTFHSGTVKVEKRMSRGPVLLDVLHLLEGDRFAGRR
jgi:hypothetical protein